MHVSIGSQEPLELGRTQLTEAASKEHSEGCIQNLCFALKQELLLEKKDNFVPCCSDGGALH